MRWLISLVLGLGLVRLQQWFVTRIIVRLGSSTCFGLVKNQRTTNHPILTLESVGKGAGNSIPSDFPLFSATAGKWPDVTSCKQCGLQIKFREIVMLRRHRRAFWRLHVCSCCGQTFRDTHEARTQRCGWFFDVGQQRVMWTGCLWSSWRGSAVWCINVSWRPQHYLYRSILMSEVYENGTNISLLMSGKENKESKGM